MWKSSAAAKFVSVNSCTELHETHFFHMSIVEWIVCLYNLGQKKFVHDIATSGISKSDFDTGILLWPPKLSTQS